MSGDQPRDWLWPAIIACGAFLSVAVTIDPSGSYPNLIEGPGITPDEVWNTQQGWFVVQVFSKEPRLLLSPEVVYGHPKVFNDHPPLGRIVLGLAENFAPRPEQPEPQISTAAARFGSALMFGLTVFLCGWCAARWFETTAGIFAALALWTMPRVFGHAHIAALESSMNLTWMLGVLAVARWSRSEEIRKRDAAIAGACLGLAFLTKIQGALLPIPVTIWAFLHFRGRALLPLIICGSVCATVFFVGWPHLWNDPVTNIKNFFASSTQRATLHAWYFGEQFADKDVPWHYPFVMFLGTMPALWLICGAYGIREGLRDQERTTRRRLSLLLICLCFLMVLFALPGVAVYDGVRLFLVCMPMWAVLAGLGAKHLLARIKKARRAICIGLVTAQFAGMFLWHPHYLSQYNLFLGAGWGAEKLGMERDYWGQGMTRSLLKEIAEHVPSGERIALVPTTHYTHPLELLDQSPILKHHFVKIEAFDAKSKDPPTYLLVFWRLADLPPDVRELIANSTVLAEVRRHGVPMATLLRARD